MDGEERCFEMNEAIRRHLLTTIATDGVVQTTSSSMSARFPVNLGDEYSQRLLKDISRISDAKEEWVDKEQPNIPSHGASPNASKSTF